ncbi:MAG TPA: gliding motility-associated C-terminal domain-containing protein, partial [Brumimicrobium sp.]|nr:gliding motility-associated C-terminal domain-containing protein [Brumimicrobium sp.]
ITYIIGNSTCGDTVSINVGVGGPTADFTADPTITSLENTVIDFTNESQNAVDYTWDFGDNSANVNDIDPTHVFSNIEPGTYTVTLTAYDANNCTDTQTVIITIVAPEMNYEIPNVFTPNGDGDNEFFQLINGVNIDNLEVIVLNRWGNLVFESDKVDFKWNGLKNNNGPECTDGTYFYKILLSTKSGEEVEEHGFVQLSRGQ